jgi:hypothetical protein
LPSLLRRDLIGGGVSMIFLPAHYQSLLTDKDRFQLILPLF